MENFNTIGIYTITNLVNNKIYVGSTTNSLFKNEKLATKFYDSAARYYHKEFAKCNFNENFIEPKV